MKKHIWIGICLLAVTLSGCKEAAGAYFESAAEESTESAGARVPETEAEAPEAKECYVHVCGAVKNPGVYKLREGSRIYEAVELAGGLLEEACADSVNQAEEVSDGQMVKVPAKEEAHLAAEEAADSTKETDSGLVNINTADAEELMTLPGIGASKAESILAYRTEQGSFASVEEIMNITGIKEGVYSKIRDYITVN